MEVPSDTTHVLDTPTDFYQAMIQHIQQATHRIVMAALYLGDDELTAKLMAAIREQLQAQPDLQVTLLCDHTRAFRTGEYSTAQQCADLVASCPGRVNAVLWQHPFQRTLPWNQMPPRFREGGGVMHMKAAVFDDTVLLTGANLSHQYFANRQDRYMLFKGAAELADYVQGAVQAVGNTGVPCNDPAAAEAGSQVEALQVADALRTFTRSRASSEPVRAGLEPGQTRVFPLFQFGPGQVQDDAVCTKQVLEGAHGLSSLAQRLSVATGYFNLPTEYVRSVSLTKFRAVDFLTSAPQCNGFYGARGPAGAIPQAYTEIEKHFLQRVGPNAAAALFEYARPDWTFHGKGAWLSLQRDADLPAKLSDPAAHPVVRAAYDAAQAVDDGVYMTMIGSPNFGHRSVHRDLELQFVILTRDAQLKRQLEEERARLWDPQHTQQVTSAELSTPERSIQPASADWSRGAWVSPAWRIIQSTL